MKYLEVTSVSKHFGGVRALKGVSAFARRGEIVGIIGPNGAGKTTLFNVISGVYRADTGSVKLDQVELTKKAQHEITRLGIARTFQTSRLFKGMSVLDNIKTACGKNLQYGIVGGLLRLGTMRKEEKKIHAQAYELLEKVDLLVYQNDKPSSLPYGFQRNLEILIALATEPKVLLLDEPAAGLCPHEVISLIKFIKKVHAENDITILLIEHRMEVVMDLCKRVYVLNFGENLANGTPEDIRADEDVIGAYLGEEEQQHAAN